VAVVISALILNVCMIAQPTKCYRETMPATGVACVMGPVTVAEWSAEHPEWRVVSWGCRR
jgi:hypothetical protein